MFTMRSFIFIKLLKLQQFCIIAHVITRRILYYDIRLILSQVLVVEAVWTFQLLIRAILLQAAESNCGTFL